MTGMIGLKGSLLNKEKTNTMTRL